MPSMMLVAACVVLFIVDFLLGSIPWGVVISKIFYKKDIRDSGSGNIGTTNAMRSMGKVGGSVVFLLDFGKGLLSGFLALVANWTIEGPLTADAMYTYADLPILLGVAFIACVWGHIFSPWLKFKGGKGIAVAIGALFFTFGLWGALIELAVFIVLVVATRYVSVGSLGSAVACPIIAAVEYLWLVPVPFTFWCCTLTALTVIWAHRANIKRLARGNENRIGSKKTSH